MTRTKCGCKTHHVFEPGVSTIERSFDTGDYLNRNADVRSRWVYEVGNINTKYNERVSGKIKS